MRILNVFEWWCDAWSNQCHEFHISVKHSFFFITARIRRMGEGYVFTLCVSPHPPAGQQCEYVLRGGRYASCVHAGGLSCFFYVCDSESYVSQKILRNILIKWYMMNWNVISENRTVTLFETQNCPCWRNDRKICCGKLVGRFFVVPHIVLNRYILKSHCG